jgi:hypothetical protein
MILNMVISVMAVLIGAVITWYFSWRYYKKAGAELVEEAKKLLHLNNIMLNAMEDAGLVKLNRNKAGETVGRMVEASAVFEGHSTMMGDLQVKRVHKA